MKLEGGTEMADTVRLVAERGVPVCAHIGLTPQKLHALGGFRVQGRSVEQAAQLIEAARALAGMGKSNQAARTKSAETKALGNIMRCLHECRTPIANLAYDKRRQPCKGNKAILTATCRGATFNALPFIFLEGAEARAILTFDKLFDALILPRAALQK